MVTVSLIRDGVTATSCYLHMMEVGFLRRWVMSSIRLSGGEVNRYHFIAMADTLDISATDLLQEVTLSATVYQIVNKRVVPHSHMEFDLEPTHA